MEGRKSDWERVRIVRPQRIPSSSDQEFCKLHFGGDMRVRFAVAGAVMSLALSVAAQKEMHMVHAKGSFDIKMTPAEPTDFEKANDITRVTSDKTWHGDFEGVSHGEMITGSTASTRSVGYVAIHALKGNLKGRKGGSPFSARPPRVKAV